MKRVSRPTRMALSEMIAMPKPSASADVSQMSCPTRVAVGLSASLAAELDWSAALTKSWAPMYRATSETARPMPKPTAPTAARISANCGMSGRRARVARNR